ncbi:MAG: hypothetical protein GVY02_06810, partial [Bacteroidetes bacterium]|nr:hypothetical protein [Bacteroidota bacterium]
MEKTRILFSVDDYKSARWADELIQYNTEVLSSGAHTYSEILTILKGFVNRQRVHLFVFRYLNDHRTLQRSLKYLIRDALIILISNLLGTRILWVMHNVDRETVCYHPRLNRLRRMMIQKSADRILVTDPHLLPIAEDFGVSRDKLGWTCFGPPKPKKVDLENKKLKKEITQFREHLRSEGFDTVFLGLCASEAAVKKNHYLKAHTVVGASDEKKESCVGLIMIGNFPKGPEFEIAKKKVIASPYILYIEEPLCVNEAYIRDEIDFFYRSMTDQSVAYTFYVACSLEKPVFTHNTGALPVIVENEEIGWVIHTEKDIPGFISRNVQIWNPLGSKR